MSTFRKMSVALATTAVALVMMPVGASAETDSNHDGEPDCLEVSITVEPSSQTVVGGNPVTIHARAVANDAPDPAGKLTIRLFGKNYVDNDNDNTITANAPKVTKKKTVTVTANFTPSDACDGPPDLNTDVSTTVTNSTAVVPANFVITRDNHVTPASYLKPVQGTATVTLLPLGGTDGTLPNTGGTNAWYLILGAALLAVGAGIVGVMSRRAKKFI